MGRAGGFAGGGAGIVAVDTVLIPVVDGPLLRAPFGFIGKLLPGVLHGAVLGTQLLAQLHRAGGTDLHAPAAGHAVLRLHLGHIGRTAHVGGVVQLGGPQGVAHVHVAVADGEDLLLAVDVGDLVDEAVVLRLLQDLHHLVICNIASALVGLHHVVGHVAHGDAPALGIVAAALAQLGTAGPAGAGGGGILALVLLQPVGDMLHAGGLVLGLNGLFHGDDVHPDARPSGGHHGGDLLQRQEGHPLEEGGNLRMLLDLLHAHVEELRAAGDELGQDPALLVAGILPVQILPVVFQQADEAHVRQQLFQLFGLQTGELLELDEGLGLSDPHFQGHVRHLVGDQPGQAPVLRVVSGDAAQFGGDPVGNHPAQPDDLLTGLVRAGDLEGEFALIQRHVGSGLLSHVRFSSFIPRVCTLFTALFRTRFPAVPSAQGETGRSVLSCHIVYFMIF